MLRHRDEIARHKPGGRIVRYDPRDLDAYMASQRVEPTAEA
jgi:hypothetical protein